jgi:predicted RNA-binding Zn ribbon-like protein
MTHEGLP